MMVPSSTLSAVQAAAGRAVAFAGVVIVPTGAALVNRSGLGTRSKLVWLFSSTRRTTVFRRSTQTGTSGVLRDRVVRN